MSRMAILNPAPNSVNSRIASSLLDATSVSTLPRTKVRYAKARRDDRPTRPRSWCSWDRPNRSAFSMIRVLTLGISTPVSMMVVHTSTSISFSSTCRQISES